MITRRALLATAAALPLRGASLALPSQRQLRWHELETTAFLHFTINTFTDKEWGYGDEDPNLFQPAKFDPDAIVDALAGAGMKGVILTCKHHDGFCLWPTKTTEHSIRATSWRGGKGDVVRDIAGAAKRKGLGFGVYLSPWDRNTAAYGTPKYVEMYRAQLTELLTQYGPIFEVWHDGANGGDGYYGGAREKRTIDKRTYYDWPNTWALVRKLQPNAVIFSDVGPDLRWVGNERGIAGDPCWATFDPVANDGGPASPGDVREKESPTGHRNGSHWLPAECDVSIRPGWFWHERENARVKKPAQLIDLYYKSVGRGATFGKPVASGRGLELRLPRPAEFDVIRIREDIRQGQRIDSAVVERFDGGWKPVAAVTSVGPRRLVKLDQPVTADRLRLRVTQSAAEPVVSEFAVFKQAAY
jgi:alpha-L-fucosidase